MAWDEGNGEWVEQCGKTTVRYPKGCAFLCHCETNLQGVRTCIWGVACNGGTYVTWGTGLVREPDPPGNPRPPHVKVVGPLNAVAALLQKVWKRPVTVRVKSKAKSEVRRTFTSKRKPEEIAEALGLELGPKPKPKRKRVI